MGAAGAGQRQAQHSHLLRSWSPSSRGCAAQSCPTQDPLDGSPPGPVWAPCKNTDQAAIFLQETFPPGTEPQSPALAGGFPPLSLGGKTPEKRRTANSALPSRSSTQDSLVLEGWDGVGARQAQEQGTQVSLQLTQHCCMAEINSTAKQLPSD